MPKGHEVRAVEDVRPTDRWSWIVASLLAFFFLSASAYIATQRLFWFDEIFTVSIARLPDLATVWKALGDYMDSAPIGYHILVRAAYNLSGQWDVSIRLLSAGAVAAAMLIVFDCARRLTDGLYGLIAPCVLASSCLAFYAYEARAYAVLTMLTALSLWLWIHTKERSRAAAILFGAVFFLAVTTHFYAVLGLTPYGVWEIYRGRFRRLPCPKLIAGIIGVVCGCALCSTQILTSSRMTKGGSWSPPSIPVLTGIFSEIFPGSLFWLVCIMAVAVLFLNEKRPAGPMRNGERVSWFFLSIPFAGYLIAEVLTNFLYYRHFLLLLPGVAVGFACFIGRQFGANRKIAWGVLLLLGGFAIRSEVLTALHPERILYFGDQQAGTRAALALEDDMLADGKIYITSPGPLLISEVRYYSKRPDLYVELRPAPWQLARARYDTSVLYWDMDDLKRHASETAVLSATPEWTAEMARAGIRSAPAPKHPEVLYLSAD
jgi:hypothetical protein